MHAAVDRDLERIQSRFTLCQRRGNITLQRTCGGRGAVCGDKQHPGLVQMAEEAHGVVSSVTDGVSFASEFPSNTPSLAMS